MKKRNEFVLQGTLIKVSENSKAGSVQLITDATEKTIPEVTISRSSMIRRFKPKDRVRIKGHAITRISKEDPEKVKFYTVLYGDSIDYAPRALIDYLPEDQLAEKGGGYGEDKNEAIFVGSVLSCNDLQNGIVILTLNCSMTEKRQSVEIFCFKRQANYAKKLNKGDLVAVCGGIRTNHNKVGLRNMQQDITCKDISLIKQVELDTQDSPTDA